MPHDEDRTVRDTLRAFRSRRIEPSWDRLDTPDRARLDALWGEIESMGVTRLTSPDAEGALDARIQVDVVREMGAASPSLAYALISHATALSLLHEAANSRLPPDMATLASSGRLALAGSVLDGRPSGSFVLRSNGTVSLAGTARLGLAHPDLIIVPAVEGDAGRLVVLRPDAGGVRFAAGASGHGLRFVPFGELTLDCQAIPIESVMPWPASCRAARQADGLVAALLSGVAGELSDRAMGYALERRQGGKAIHEHDAVQELTGPIELARRTLESLALAVLDGQGLGEGAASALGIDMVRQAGLDAVQTYGGYGYMQDYRVERYLRDANTLETCWIHAAARRRAIARTRFAEMAG